MLLMVKQSVPNGHALQRPLCAAGELGAAVNVRTLTTHIGFVRMAVTAPKWGAGKKRERRSVNGRSAREGRRMRTRFGGVEEILGGGEGFVWRIQGRTTLKLVITSTE